MKTHPSPSYILGIDLGNRSHAVCVLGQDGTILKEFSISSDRQSLTALSRRYPNALIVFEVGMHSPWTSRHFEALGHRTIVANPRKVRSIYENDRKCDQKDAAMLAKLARVDESLLYPIKHGSEEAQRDLLLIKLRDNLVHQRVDIISSVRFVLKSLGVQTRSPKTSSFPKYIRTYLRENHPDHLAGIEHSLTVLDCMNAQIKEMEKRIETLSEIKYPETQTLRQITGVGPITALTFRLTIEDPKRFKKGRDVGAYLGLVPKRDQSEDSDKQLRISKAGDAYLRRLLVNAAQYILGPFGPDTDLKAHGNVLAERGGPRAKKKAVIATARKLAVLMLSLWKNQSVHEECRNEAA